MDRFFHSDRQGSDGAIFLLCFSWCTGLLLGGFTAASFPGSWPPELLPGSLSGRMLVLCVPFLVSALAASICGVWALFPLAFAKAFVFAFLSTALAAACTSGGWLLRFLVLFTDCCTMPLLFGYWVRLCRDPRQLLWLCGAAHWLPTLAVGYLDFCYVSPLTATLLS